jgi:NSS family neurotransmitter:Na+ symporter
MAVTSVTIRIFPEPLSAWHSQRPGCLASCRSAIFPAVFAFGYEPNAGPSLLFLTIPSVFASMPLGNVFMVIFFILTFIASIGAQISLVEVPVAFLEEKFHLSRKVASISTVVAIAVFGALAALSNSLLADVKLLGMTFFDLFDYTTSNILLPLGGLFHRYLHQLGMGNEEKSPPR